MDQLLRLTHRQWLHRNARLYFRRSDGRTQAKHEEIVSKIEHLVWTDPEELLDKDRRLLEVDLGKLGMAKATTQECWIAEVEAALGEAKSSWRANTDTEDARLRRTAQEPTIDTEGSIRYRRRRKK